MLYGGFVSWTRFKFRLGNQNNYMLPWKRGGCTERATMDDNEIEKRLETVIAGTNRDLEWAWEQYHEKIEDAKSKATGDMPESALVPAAVKMVQGEAVKGSRSTGDVEEVNILAIGHGGVRQWNDSDNGGKKDVLIAYGIVNPPSDPAGVGVFICDETDGVDLGNIRSNFRTMNYLKGWFSVSESDELPNTYLCWSSDKTRVEPDETEMSRDEKREFVHNFVDEEAEIGEIAQHLSRTNEDGFTADYGADMKRLTGMVVDTNRLDGANNIYTLLDDSVVDPSELGDNVVSDNARSPGLTAWCPDDFFEYGENSHCEFYGPISRGDDGQITMNIVGVVPLIPFDLEEPEGQNEPDTASEERI